MGIRYSLIAAAVAALFVASSASAFEFHGYFRDGPGWNGKGGGQACFQLPGAEFKARLGNECNHYYEFSLSEQVYKDANGVEAKIEWMPAYGVDTANPTAPPATGGPGYGFGTGNVYTQQIWGGIKMPGGTTWWAGQRYFKRHDVHSIDWFYWNPYQGDAAAGVEDIDLGFGKLALTVGRAEAIGTVAAPVKVSQGTYMVPEVRIYGIPILGGALELGVDLGIAMDQSDALGAGRTGVSPWFTAEYLIDKFLGGQNKLTFQYASGAEAAMTSGVISGANSDPKQWRIIENLVFMPSPDINGQLVLIYQDQDKMFGGAPTTAASPGTGAKIFTAELRPAYSFSDYFKISVDAFYQSLSLKDSTQSAATLFKLTVAPTLVTGRGYWARPEIRLYATYGVWNDSAVALGGVGGGAFGTDKNGVSYGVQMETWF